MEFLKPAFVEMNGILFWHHILKKWKNKKVMMYAFVFQQRKEKNSSFKQPLSAFRYRFLGFMGYMWMHHDFPVHNVDFKV